MTPPTKGLLGGFRGFDLARLLGVRPVTPHSAGHQRRAEAKRQRRRTTHQRRVATGGMLSTKGYVYGPASLTPRYQPPGRSWYAHHPWKIAR